MDCSPPGCFVHEILQAKILEWEAIPFSRGSSSPRNPVWVTYIVGRLFTVSATREAVVLWKRELNVNSDHLTPGSIL